MARQSRILSGKVVAITGGARGIGLATAQACARKGMKVAIGDLAADLASQSAASIGPDAVGLALDVTSRESFAAFLEQVAERIGPVDVLVNNAGIMPVGPFLEEDDDTARRQFDINVHGVIYGMKLALPEMVARNSGHVVNVASMAGKGGFPLAATYCGTKHAVVGMSEAVRGELRETDVEISCVMPSFVNTELTSGLRGSRAIKIIETSDVADAIVEALAHNRFDVFVPRNLGPINKVMTLFPRRAREKVAEWLDGDKALQTVDPGTRARYEDRAAHSEPSLAPEDERPRETEKV